MNFDGQGGYFYVLVAERGVDFSPIYISGCKYSLALLVQQTETEGYRNKKIKLPSISLMAADGV